MRKLQTTKSLNKATSRFAVPLALCCVIIAVCAIAVFWRRTQGTSVSKAISETNETYASVAANAPVRSADPLAGRDRGTPDSHPAPLVLHAGDVSPLVARIARYLESGDSESRDVVLTNLLPVLVLVDPIAAGNFAATNTIEDTRDAVLQATAHLLAAHDPTNAIAWAGALPQQDERESALTDVCLQLSETDPAGAVKLRESLLADYQSYDEIEDLVQRWAMKDLPASLAWVNELPAGVRRDQLIGRVAYVESLTAPADAAVWVTSAMTPGDEQIEAAMSVLQQWGRQDLAAATRWAQSFPEGPLRERALTGIANIVRDQQRAAGN
jgi:hypothetical protein